MTAEVYHLQKERVGVRQIIEVTTKLDTFVFTYQKIQVVILKKHNTRLFEYKTRKQADFFTVRFLEKINPLIPRYDSILQRNIEMQITPITPTNAGKKEV